MRKIFALALLVVLAIFLAGFHEWSKPHSARAATVSAPVVPGKYTHILLFTDENHDISTTRGHMPNLDPVADAHVWYSHLAAGYHPSLPNYINLVAGSNLGVTDDAGPSSHKLTQNNLFRQLRLHGNTWKGYHDAMTGTCKLTNGPNNYIVHHNAAPYFSASADRADCIAHDGALAYPGFTQLVNDLQSDATTPNFLYLVPSNCHNGHKNTCVGSADTVKQADDYFGLFWNAVKNTPVYQSGNLLILFTWDEGRGTSQNVYTVAISPSTSGGPVATSLKHVSILRYVEDNFGLTRLLKAGTAPQLTGPGL